jgi:amidase
MKVTRRQFVKTSVLSSIGVGLTPNIVNGLRLSSEQDTLDIINLPVHKLTNLILKKKVSSYEVVSAFVKRIEVVNPGLNAVVAFRPEEALKEATKADEELSKGKRRGALHGIPCTIKDSFDTEGIVSTGGTLGRSNFIPKKNATIVQRLKDAGAIIMGKTNTPEFTMSYFTDNLVYGKTKNPYDLNRSPGGSSGGAAAIIAAGGSPFDIGTDTGGSIRFPAHCCGIAGIKPTSGRVPRTGHIVAYQGVSQSLTHVGPISRSVEDLNLLLNIISGVDNIDPYVYPLPLQDFKQVDFKKLRVAFYIDNGLFKPSEDTFQTIQKITKIISTAGLSIGEDIPKGIEETATLWDSYLLTGDWLKRMLDQYETTKTSLNWIYDLPNPSSSEYAILVEKVDNFRSSLLSFWKNYDVLVCPVSPMPAPLSNAESELDVSTYFSYTSSFNITGWPCVVIRGGTSIEGLPIGVQIVAPPWREDICLSLAKFLENELGPWKKFMTIDKG